MNTQLHIDVEAAVLERFIPDDALEGMAAAAVHRLAHLRGVEAMHRRARTFGRLLLVVPIFGAVVVAFPSAEVRGDAMSFMFGVLFLANVWAFVFALRRVEGGFASYCRDVAAMEVCCLSLTAEVSRRMCAKAIGGYAPEA